MDDDWRERDLVNEGHVTSVKSKPEKCPLCGSPKVAPIQYGLPAFTPELIKAMDEGRIVLGGCIPAGPSWKCVDCGEAFEREREMEV